MLMPDPDYGFIASKARKTAFGLLPVLPGVNYVFSLYTKFYIL